MPEPILERARIECRALTGWFDCHVAAPRDVEGIRQCTEIAHGKGLSVCPMGGGTSMGDICVLDDHIVLDLKRLNRIKEYDKERGIITEVTLKLKRIPSFVVECVSREVAISEEVEEILWGLEDREVDFSCVWANPFSRGEGGRGMVALARFADSKSSWTTGGGSIWQDTRTFPCGRLQADVPRLQEARRNQGEIRSRPAVPVQRD